MSVVTLLVLMLQGCPDPTTASELGHGPGGASGGGAPGTGAGKPLGPPPAPGSFDVAPGTGVTISGTLVYAGSQTGVFRIDFLQREGEAPPILAHMVELEGPGPFTVEAPPGTGSLYVVGFVDVKGDGPSASDPAGMLAEQIVVGTDAVADLVLTLTDDPDLGEFVPGDHQVAPMEEIPIQEEAPTEVTPEPAPMEEIPDQEEAPPAEETPEAAPTE